MIAIKEKKKADIFIILGPPLSGKGTQASLLAEKLKIPFFSIGDIVRSEVEKGGEEAEKIKKIIEKGKLLPASLVNKLVSQKIFSLKEGKRIIIDGYPRNLAQLKFFLKIVKEKNKNFWLIYLKVRHSFLYKRAALRRYCPQCKRVFKDGEVLCPFCGVALLKREDDKKSVLKKRLLEYKKETKPVLDYLKKQKKVLEVNGEGSVEEVFEDLLNKLSKVNEID